MFGKYLQNVMAEKFLEITFTDSVRKAQEHYFGSSRRVKGTAENDALTEDEINFVQSRDSFYMATASESGWPYMQHRGGSPGFLHVVNPSSLAFADYRGNRQVLSTGNVAVNDRVCLFLIDYPQRARLKILGHARVEDASLRPDLVAKFSTLDVQRLVERVFFIDVVSFDWNCQQYITPRYTAAEVEHATEHCASVSANLNPN